MAETLLLEGEVTDDRVYHILHSVSWSLSELSTVVGFPVSILKAAAAVYGVFGGNGRWAFKLSFILNADTCIYH